MAKLRLRLKDGLFSYMKIDCIRQSFQVGISGQSPSERGDGIGFGLDCHIQCSQAFDR